MTERLTITIETGNAAFADDPCRELARILRAQADLIESGMATDETPLRDVNGNRVGVCIIEEFAQCDS
jgi:hypothetical protein